MTIWLAAGQVVKNTKWQSVIIKYIFILISLNLLS